MSALSADEELAILKHIDAIRDAHTDLDDLCEALSASLRDLVGAAEAAFFLREDDDWLAVGEVSSPLVIAADALPTDAEWRIHHDGEIHALAMTPSGALLGAAVFSRPGALDAADRARVEAFTLQADSALSQALAFRDLQDRNAELSAIYAIDHIRDEHLEFDMMLGRVVDHVLSVIPAETALFGLAQAGDPEQRLRVVGPPGLELDETTTDAVRRYVRDAFAAGGIAHRDHVGSYAGGMCVPLILHEQIIGGLAVLGGDFQPRDARILTAIGSQVDTAIFEDLSRQRIKSVFKRYVSDSVVEEMLSDNATDYLRGVRREATIIFSDLRGFTTVSESLSVDLLVQMLNEHLAAMTEIVFRNGGTVDKFIGDCVMAFWGAPVRTKDHAVHAVRAACEMRDAHNALRVEWEARGLPAPKIGIGINTGEVMVGNIGGERLSSYTVIGDHVNLAARMEGLSAGDDVLVTQSTLDALGPTVDRFEPRGEVVVKGKTVPVATYNIVTLKA